MSEDVGVPIERRRVRLTQKERAERAEARRHFIFRKCAWRWFRGLTNQWVER
jgi:hypothetical protein